MPIYEYKCNKCNKTFELLVRSDTQPSCPNCKSENLKKLVSGFMTISTKQPQPANCQHSCCCSDGCPCKK